MRLASDDDLVASAPTTRTVTVLGVGGICSTWASRAERNLPKARMRRWALEEWALEAKESPTALRPNSPVATRLRADSRCYMAKARWTPRFLAHGRRQPSHRSHTGRVETRPR